MKWAQIVEHGAAIVLVALLGWMGTLGLIVLIHYAAN